MALGGFARDPLAHFLLGGLLLFVLYGVLAPGDGGAPGEVVVPATRVVALAEGFERTWMRPPTQVELAGLVQDYVDEEILYREALTLGLDRDDLVVRRRLRQKMEFLHLDLEAPPEPDDEALEALLRERADHYRVPARISFEQVFFASTSGADLEHELGSLRAGGDPSALGNASLLPRRLHDATPREIEAAFGAEFAGELAEAAVGGWVGPVASSYGRHLVRIAERQASRAPTLDEARAELVRDYQARQRALREQAFLDELRARYEVRIETPPATATSPEVADGDRSP